MQEGVCRDRGRHSGREESGQLCAQLEGELKGVQSYSHHLPLSPSPAIAFYGAAGRGQPSSPASSQ